MTGWQREAAEYGESTDAHDVDQFRRRSAAATACATEKEQEEKAKQVFILPTFANIWHMSSCLTSEQGMQSGDPIISSRKRGLLFL